MPRSSSRPKAGGPAASCSTIPMSLMDKAASASMHASGYALDETGNGGGNGAHGRNRKRNGSSKRKRNHSRRRANEDAEMMIKSNIEARRAVPRTFRNVTNLTEAQAESNAAGTSNGAAAATDAAAIATPACRYSYLRSNIRTPHHSRGGTSSGTASASQGRNEMSTATKSAIRTPYNPYTNRAQKTVQQTPGPSQKIPSHSSTHVICAVSENLAKETCITTIDAGSPVTLQVHKMGNGQMYAETISFLKLMNPHEILLNEGRRNSQLCQKVLRNFSKQGLTHDNDHDAHDDDDDAEDDTTMTTAIRTPQPRSSKADLTGACSTKTVIKFVPRSYFDQNRGAELLRSIARESALDTSTLQEYIFLSSAYAVLQYLQICLGANFARNSLAISMNWGGKNRMAIDRSSIRHLEILANAKTGKAQQSLIGTVDCTKTSVGSRLLRTNLISPPTRLDTINARLDLVDSFLEDEQFFYEVMDLLVALPDVEKMLTHMALIPKNRGGGRSGGSLGKRQVTARMASKGISALVCIKSALSVVPNFARVLEIQLKHLIKRDKKILERKMAAETETYSVTSRSTDAKSHPLDRSERSSTENDKNDNRDQDINDDSSKSSQSTASEKSVDDTDELSIGIDDDSDETIVTSLLLGLGSGPMVASEGNFTRHQLLRAILIAMKNPMLNEILEAVMDIFTESTSYSKNSHAMRHQECFALKPNTDGMMDVLRKAFLANVSDIYKLADEYAEANGFTVTVKETAARGYYLAIPVNTMNSDLPPNFIQPVKTGRFINCTTEEVLSLSSRAQENVQDLLLMTHDRIQEVIDIAREKYDALASLSDAIALIDLCHSFADNVASNRLPWCRPVVTDSPSGPKVSNPEQNSDKFLSRGDDTIGSGSIAIKNGRYAIDVRKTGLMSSGLNNGEFVPNDTYASVFQNLTLLSGINGSGKSTYLKQLAITVILAHCGSYVPAEEAFIPIRDRICTRIGTSDDQEHNISTFMQEMKDTAFICRNATNKSLILIDELGRATSNEDGVAIAWAVAEFMLLKRAMTFFVTHYPQLCRLADVYPNVQNQHLGTVVEEEGLKYMHKILPGPCQMSADYGVEMAATCGWQRDVLEMARVTREKVEKQLPGGVLCQSQSDDSVVHSMAAKHKAESILGDLAKHLVALRASEEGLSDDARRSYLEDLHDQYSSPSDANVAKIMKNLLLEHDMATTPILHLKAEGITCRLEGETNLEAALSDIENITVDNIRNDSSSKIILTKSSSMRKLMHANSSKDNKKQEFEDYVQTCEVLQHGNKEIPELQNHDDDLSLSHIRRKPLANQEMHKTGDETSSSQNDDDENIDDEGSIDNSSSSSSSESSSPESSSSSSSSSSLLSSSSSSLSSSISLTTEDDVIIQHL